MSEIFISYSSKDRKLTTKLASVLEKNGWSVWWDKHIAPGAAFDRAISKALDAARCIVVIWSKNSVMSDWVMEEALEGAQRKILLPIRIDSVGLPFGFRRFQTLDFAGWKGSASSECIKQLVGGIGMLVKPERDAKPKKPAAKSSPPKRTRKLSGALDGKTIVFTGALAGNRLAHAEKVKTVGARFVNSVSGNTDFLVIGDEPGEVKLGAAAEYGVRKISERQWIKMLDNAYGRILQGKTIVFTGKLDRPRAELEVIAKKLGARPADSISENTAYVIVGADAGKKKLAEAQKHHVGIIKEAVWNDIVATLKA